MDFLIDEILEKYNFDNYPIKYKRALNEIVKVSLKIFGDNLVNITLGGSGGKNKIHEGWSDLDIYFVFHKFDNEQIEKFMSIKWNHSIHIGTTYYTLAEVQNDMIDRKTKIMIYEKNNYNVNPTLYGKDVFLNVLYDEVKNNDISNLPNMLHEIRRIYISIKNKEIKLQHSHVKKLLVLLKCILNYNGKFVFGYEEVFNEFYKLIDDKLTYQNADAIIKIIGNINESTDIFLSVCDDIFLYLTQVWEER